MSSARKIGNKRRKLVKGLPSNEVYDEVTDDKSVLKSMIESNVMPGDGARTADESLMAETSAGHSRSQRLVHCTIQNNQISGEEELAEDLALKDVENSNRIQPKRKKRGLKLNRRNNKLEEQHVDKVKSKAANKGKEKMVDPDDSDSNPGRKSNGRYPRIKHRCQVKLFVETLGKMNAIQRREVEDIGFGSLFLLKDIKIPSYLCWWLAEQYNPKKGKIILCDGSSLDVTEQDVEICLGIPRGPLEILKVDPLLKMDTLLAWRSHIGRKMHEIRNSDVAQSMLNSKNGGKRFLQDFIVLFHSCIVEPQQSGAANQSLIRSLDRVDDLRRMNWCEFVIKCLTEAKIKWDNNRNSFFTGPLLFLTILYLDRVVIYSKRAIERRLPAFIGWTKDLVANRESSEMSYGGFGDGNVDAKQIISELHCEDQHVHRGGHPSNTNQEFKRELGEDLRNLLHAIVAIGEKMNKVPEGCKEDEVSKALIHTSNLLLDSKAMSLHEARLGEKILIQSHQDSFWTDEQLMKMVEEIQDVITRPKVILKIKDEA